MSFRLKRGIAVVVSLMGLLIIMFAYAPHVANDVDTNTHIDTTVSPARDALAMLSVKGKAPKTGYERTQFGNGWATTKGCDTREIILNRDLENVTISEACQVESGTLHDPYTGKDIQFQRGPDSSAVQIDHVVALGNAWQTGAQLLTADKRKSLANDPLELLAVDGKANQQKSDGDAATWLPSNKMFRCEYVARQIAVKERYKLWVTQAEHDAMEGILNGCPNQPMPAK